MATCTRRRGRGSRWLLAGSKRLAVLVVAGATAAACSSSPPLPPGSSATSETIGSALGHAAGTWDPTGDTTAPLPPGALLICHPVDNQDPNTTNEVRVDAIDPVSGQVLRSVTTPDHARIDPDLQWRPAGTQAVRPVYGVTVHRDCPNRPGSFAPDLRRMPAVLQVGTDQIPGEIFATDGYRSFDYRLATSLSDPDAFSPTKVGAVDALYAPGTTDLWWLSFDDGRYTDIRQHPPSIARVFRSGSPGAPVFSVPLAKFSEPDLNFFPPQLWFGPDGQPLVVQVGVQDRLEAFGPAGKIDLSSAPGPISKLDVPASDRQVIGQPYRAPDSTIYFVTRVPNNTEASCELWRIPPSHSAPATPLKISDLVDCAVPVGVTGG